MNRLKTISIAFVLLMASTFTGLKPALAFGGKVRLSACETALESLSSLALSIIQTQFAGNRLVLLDQYKTTLDTLRAKGLLGPGKYAELNGEYESIRSAASREISDITTSEGRPRCFVAGTLVDTPQGPRPIDSLKVGDSVYSFDFNQNKVVVSPVLHTMVKSDRDYIKVHLSNGLTLEVTPDHLFFSPEKNQFMAVGDFTEGSRFLTQNGGGLSAVPVTLEKNENRGESGTVYNIEVADHHNYFVGGILVHNARPIQ